MTDTYCEIHKIDKAVIGGCSAHYSNWYCPECEKDEDFEDAKNYALVQYFDSRTKLIRTKENELIFTEGFKLGWVAGKV